MFSQSLVVSVGKSKLVYISLIMLSMPSQINVTAVKYCNSYCPPYYGKFFMFQHDIAHAHGTRETISRLACIFAKCYQFNKYSDSILSSKFVVR